METHAGGFLSTPCQCGGTNESCFRCGGWGYIDQISQGRATPTSAPPTFAVARPHKPNPSAGSKKKPKRPRGPRPAVQCGPAAQVRLMPEYSPCAECGVLVKRMERHMRRVHDANSRPASQSANPHPPRLVACPDCGQSMRAAQLGTHRLRVHGYRPSEARVDAIVAQVFREMNAPAEAQGSLTPQSSDDELVSCSACGKLLPCRRLGEHRWAAHGRRPNSQPKVQPPPRPYATDPVPLQKIEQGERVRDATRDYYAAYREAGRFGSHPSHDGFDDESAPD